MTDDSLANTLNRHCHCINVDRGVLQKSLEARLGRAGAWSRLRESHPHLLADSPVFISHGQVRQMKELIEAGKVTPVIDTTYPLSETPEAFRYLNTGHARGKVVITVEQNDKN